MGYIDARKRQNTLVKYFRGAVNLQNKIVVGIPRGLLYYRYETLWKEFFKELNINIVVSPVTTCELAREGVAVSGSEACLALKIFFGHVRALIGKCDYILVPRVKSFGRNREMCPRFDALYDLTANTFRDKGQKLLTFNIDESAGISECDGFVQLAASLGISRRKARKAYKSAKLRDGNALKLSACEQEKLYDRDAIKILLVARNYVIEDAYIGKPIVDFLKTNSAIPIKAYDFDRQAAIRRSTEMSPTCKWEFCRETVGGIVLNRDKVDGIILVSTFPCGPDSMVNEILMRRISDSPVLNIVIDGQNGMAGLETRLESFLDIIRLKKGIL